MVQRSSRAARRRATAIVLWALGAMIVLGACSAAAPAGTPGGGPVAGEVPGQVPVPAATPAAQPAGGDIPDGTYVVRTGRLRLEVTDLAVAVDGGRRSIAALGGYVGGSEERHAAEGGWASVTYRIPVARWEDALAGLRELGRVIDLNTESADVTNEVVDLEARLANLRTTEAAFQAIMQRAETIPDVIKVQEELTAVRGQIERLTAQRDSLANRAALATLTVMFETPTIAAAPDVEGWSAAHEIDAAVASLVAVMQRLSSVAIWLGIVVLPVLLPFAVVGYVGHRLIRARQIRATMQPGDPRR
jgi:hypothetical protein